MSPASHGGSCRSHLPRTSSGEEGRNYRELSGLDRKLSSEPSGADRDHGGAVEKLQQRLMNWPSIDARRPGRPMTPMQDYNPSESEDREFSNGRPTSYQENGNTRCWVLVAGYRQTTVKLKVRKDHILELIIGIR